MSKPRIFISSTCFDLNDIRSELTSFLSSYNFEVLNSQLNNFGVSPTTHSHTACLEQVKNADFLLLIIGKRYGGTYIASTNSITNEEYNLAVKRGIPIIKCVDRQVNEQLPFYKKNPNADFSLIVNDTRIFHFIEYIASASEGNWLHNYSNVLDIKEIVKSQFSYYLLLFSQSIVKDVVKEKSVDSSKISYVKFPANLEGIDDKELDQLSETDLRNGLKELHKVLSAILISAGKNDNKLAMIKAMWVIAKFGELGFSGTYIKLNENVFKNYAWGASKGKRIADQMKTHGVWYEYDFDEDRGCDVKLYFQNQNEGCDAVYALHTYVADLLIKNDDENAFSLFGKADMRLYTK